MSDWGRLRVWLRRAAPPRSDLIRGFLMASVASVAGLALVVGSLTLLVVSEQRPGLRALGAFLVAIELVAFLRSPLRFAERLSTHRLGFAAVARWRSWLMTTVGHWSYARWQANGAGDVLERSMSDTEELQDLWLRAVIPAVATAVTSLVADVVVACVAPAGHWVGVALTLGLLQLLAGALVLTRLSAQCDAERTLRRARGDYVAALVAIQAAGPEIVALGAGDFLDRRNASAGDALRRREEDLRRAQRRDSALVPLATLASFAAVALAHPASAGVWLVVSALVALATFDFLVTLRAAVRTAAAVSGGAERLDALAAPSSSPGRPWPGAATLRFDDLVVSATSTISGEVAPGRRLGVRGASGSGKSTLLRALAGLDDAVGLVTLDGTPLRDVDEAQLRDHLLYVPAEAGLLRGYVRDVMTLGVPTKEDLVERLAAVGITTTLNEEWGELSRGEGQRIAVARAALRRPDVLLLDEPTSALGEAETRALLALLSELGSTMVVASHDERVLAWCDEVIDLSPE